MAINAAGLDVAGSNNPRWKGGLIQKKCEVCKAQYTVKPVHMASRFCSLKCVGVSQRGRSRMHAPPKRTEKQCEVCLAPFSVPTCHAKRHHCCSKTCSFARRSAMSKGEDNPSWSGGMSRFPYPWNFREISKGIIERDGAVCRNPTCAGVDSRLTTHHINYDKQDCRSNNLICLCSACNSKANFGREAWKVFYQKMMSDRKVAGELKTEEF